MSCVMGVHFGIPCRGLGRDGAAFPARSPVPLMEPTSVTSVSIHLRSAYIKRVCQKRKKRY